MRIICSNVVILEYCFFSYQKIIFIFVDIVSGRLKELSFKLHPSEITTTPACSDNIIPKMFILYPSDYLKFTLCT